MTHNHDNTHRGWIGVDFDGTLAHYATWVSPTHVGIPISPMVERVKRWLAEGREVRVFTARVWPISDAITPETAVYPALAPTERYMQAVAAVAAIRTWCLEHIGQVLTITCVKDFAMTELYDDRAVQVEKNTGQLVGYSTREVAAPQWPTLTADAKVGGGFFRAGVSSRLVVEAAQRQAAYAAEEKARTPAQRAEAERVRREAWDMFNGAVAHHAAPTPTGVDFSDDSYRRSARTLPATAAEYRSMFVTASQALDAISDELGIEQPDGGSMAILAAIAKLKATKALAPNADERATFEAMIAKDSGDLTTFGSGQHVHYRNSAVNNAWGGWKARAALVTPARPHLEWVVPLDLSDIPKEVLDQVMNQRMPYLLLPAHEGAGSESHARWKAEALGLIQKWEESDIGASTAGPTWQAIKAHLDLAYVQPPPVDIVAQAFAESEGGETD